MRVAPAPRATAAISASVVWIDTRTLGASSADNGRDVGFDVGQRSCHIDDVCTLGRELEAASHDLVRGADHPAEVQDPHDQRRHGAQRTCAIQSVAPVKERTSRRFRYRSPASSP